MKTYSITNNNYTAGYIGWKIGHGVENPTEGFNYALDCQSISTRLQVGGGSSYIQQVLNIRRPASKLCFHFCLRHDTRPRFIVYGVSLIGVLNYRGNVDEAALCNGICHNVLDIEC